MFNPDIFIHSNNTGADTFRKDYDMFVDEDQAKPKADSVVAYPMHPVCWDILLQQYSCLAAGNGLDLDVLAEIFIRQKLDEKSRGFQPDWSSDKYGGAEKLWQDGWNWMDEVDITEDGLGDIEVWDFLVRNPREVQGFTDLLQNPPTVANQTQYPSHPESQLVDASHSSIQDTTHQSDHLSYSLKSRVDCFAIFPLEIRTMILCLLPASSVTSTRLASMSMATVPLDQTYWLSRFIFPQELCHIEISTLSGRRKAGAAIDWNTLCRRLRDPEGDSFQWWENRQRISEIAKKLAEKILESQETHTDSDFGVPQSEIKAMIALQSTVCRQTLTCAGIEVAYTSKVLFDQKFPVQDVGKVSVSFERRHHLKLISSITFQHDTRLKKSREVRPNGETIYASSIDWRLGRKRSNTQSVFLKEGQRFTGFKMAFVKEGIIGVQVLVQESAGRIVALQPILGSFKGDWSTVAQGRLIPLEGMDIFGFKANFARKDRMISISLIELPSVLGPAITPELPSQLGKLWSPAPPAEYVRMTGSSRGRDDETFAFFRPTGFAKTADDLSHLVRITGFMALQPPGLTGLQFHFDDREPIPEEPLWRGHGVDFSIDGPGGERLSAVDVFWDEEELSLGVGVSFSSIFALKRHLLSVAFWIFKFFTLTLPCHFPQKPTP